MQDDPVFGILSLLCNCGVPILLLAIGLGVGSALERAHLRDLAAREETLRGVVATNLRTAPPGARPTSATLVSGSVVIGGDYFKAIAAALRKIVGGEVRSLERMMQRARREALCRMLENARAQGATTVINVRFETSSIGGKGPNSPPMAEVVAYGTAILGPR